MNDLLPFPAQIHKGDAIVVEYAAPDDDLDPDADPADPWRQIAFNLQHLGVQGARTRADTADHHYEFHNLGDDGRVRATIPSATTSAWNPGAWRYQVTAITQGGQNSTLKNGYGIVVVDDLAGTELDHERTMIQILRAAIESKMKGRGDIIQYSIGDRQVTAMSLDDLQRALYQYEERQRRADGARRLIRL